MSTWRAVLLLSPALLALLACRRASPIVGHVAAQPGADAELELLPRPQARTATAVTLSARGVTVRFLCDEKYSSEVTCDISTWKQSVAAAPREKDLLEHTAGGPHGAIWNGDAPMVVVAPTTVGEVRVSGVALELVDELGVRWFELPSSVWRAGLRIVAGQPYRAALVEVDGRPVGEIWQAEGE